MRKAVAIPSIDSWTALARLVEACADGKWIFRGEGDASNPLQAKAGRVGTYRGAARKPAYAAADERRALDLLKRQARPHLSHSPANDLEWLAIAQHHGMSTRLLDWTESLLVAAYFAAAEAGTKGDAVIYGVRGLRSVTAAEAKAPFTMKSPAVYRPPHITPRIPAQRSVFTVHPDPTAPFETKSLVRWVVAHRACGQIKRILDTCAINESSLFPDIDGLARYIGWRYKWAKLSAQ